MKATITSKGQVTIPARIRARLNLKQGDVLEFDESASILVARPALDERQMREAVGSAEIKLDATNWLDETRGPVRDP